MTNFGRQGPFLPGARLLEQYEIVRVLGIGGHAFVYECRDLFLDESLAVKVIPNPPHRGRDLLNRARAEAQLLRRLNHPNVVRMHTAAALGEDMVCLVMEKLQGVTLRHLLMILGRLSIVEAAGIARQIAVGVAAAHELNVVHRDIKPDNVFVLPPNNHVKVLDFGIAKFLGQGLQTSNKYRFQGTPIYMSPEHLRGAGVTVRSDVYQLGTVLFEMLSGINPTLLDLENPSFEQIAYAQIMQPCPSLRRMLPDVPIGLEQLIQKATAKSPEARFASMFELVEALDRSMQAYAEDHPREAQRIRYVDGSLMQSASELAAREDRLAWAGTTATDMAQSQHQRANRTLTSDESPWNGAPSILEPPETKDFPPPPPAAYDRVSFLAGSDGIPTRDLSGSSSPTGQPLTPSPKSRAVSRSFVAAALGVGAIIGVLLLWSLRRANVVNATERSGTNGEATAPASPLPEPRPVTPSTTATAAVVGIDATPTGTIEVEQRGTTPGGTVPRRASSKNSARLAAQPSAVLSTTPPTIPPHPPPGASAPASRTTEPAEIVLPADEAPPAIAGTQKGPRLLTGDLESFPQN